MAGIYARGTYVSDVVLLVLLNIGNELSKRLFWLLNNGYDIGYKLRFDNDVLVCVTFYKLNY